VAREAEPFLAAAKLEARLLIVLYQAARQNTESGAFDFVNGLSEAWRRACLELRSGPAKRDRFII
jgi:hypothetical protein